LRRRNDRSTGHCEGGTIEAPFIAKEERPKQSKRQLNLAAFFFTRMMTESL